MILKVVCLLLCAQLAMAEDFNSKAAVDSFEAVWSTLRDRYWDPTMGGLNWQQIHDRYLAKLRSATNMSQVRNVMSEMIHKLPSSHLALIPAEAYDDDSTDHESAPGPRKHHGGKATTGISVTEIDQKVVVEFSENSQVHPGWVIKSVDGESIDKLTKLSDSELTTRLVESWLSGGSGSSAEIVFVKGDGREATISVPRRLPAGKLVQFSNLPPLHVVAEHRKLPSDVGYIRLNIFLDPVSVMPEFENAIQDFQTTPGIVLDLRGNPGGLGIMAMGIAGWFVSEEGEQLGTLTGRGMKTDFMINPRAEPYTGKLAVLIDGESASTSEILAQGLKDLGRARIFGTRSAGAVLLSDIIELPDGDRFQYPEANYTSFKGRVLEGNGVEPDEVVAPTIAALLAGRDPVLEAAENWSLKK